MVTAAAGSDAAVVLVDITKLDTHAEPGAAVLPQTRRHALLAHLLRVPNIVFAVNKIDALDDPAVPPSPRCAARCSAFAEGSRHSRRRHRAGVGAARRQRHPAAGCTAWYERPVAAAVAGEPADDAGAQVDGACSACRCSTWQREPGEHGDGTGHQPRTLWGRIAHGRVKGRRRRSSCCPAASAPRSPALRRAGEDGRRAAEAGQSAGLILDRQTRRVARRLDRHAADASCRPSASGATLAWLDTEPAVHRPQVLGAPRQPLGAGAHRVRSNTVLDIHTLQAQPTRTNWRSTRSATW